MKDFSSLSGNTADESLKYEQTWIEKRRLAKEQGLQQQSKSKAE